MDWSLPLKNPVLIFSLVLFIILFAPILLNRFKIPHIIGLIFAGIIIGPYGFNFMLRDSSIILFGTVGLLYIMFLAGLEIDLSEFKKNRQRSLVFGLFTFSIPMTLGTLVSYYVLEFSMMTSVLLASMFASHTLVAYPIASRFGVTKTKAVTITVGGTMITDTLALLVLAVIAGMARGEIGQEFWIRLIISVILFAALVVIGFPFIARWFFKKYDDNISQYIFVLGLVFLAAFLAELAGVEAIIGAFLSGLALNRFIPHTSPLMNRIEFVGNALFIPFFLIGVGMLVDLRVMFTGGGAFLVALTMTAVATLAKFLAAFATQKAFNLTKYERGMIFGLSNAQAAATLAAVLVGYNISIGETEDGEMIRLLNEDVLNGTIMMILVTCTISSFAVERASRALALTEEVENPSTEPDTQDRVLIPLARPETMEGLLSLAVLMKKPRTKTPLYLLSVVDEQEGETQGKAATATKMLERASKIAASSDQPVETIMRYDYNITSGIMHTVKEKNISEIILGLHQKTGLIDSFLGDKIEGLLRQTENTIIISKSVQPFNTIKNIIVAVPERAEFEVGFAKWFDRLRNMSKQTGSSLTFHASRASLDIIRQLNQSYKETIDIIEHEFNEWEDFLILSREVKRDDLFVVINAREGSISYHPVFEKIPAQLSKYFNENSLLIIFPEQHKLQGEHNFQYLDKPVTVPLKDNLDKAGRFVKNLFKNN